LKILSRIVLGILALLWTICWFYFTAESPSTHSTITDEEATYIEANLFHPISRVEKFDFFLKKTKK
jgi:hypothetical protein